MGNDPLYTGLGGTGAENLALTEIRSADRPAHSESLYRLRYSCAQTCFIFFQNDLPWQSLATSSRTFLFPDFEQLWPSTVSTYFKVLTSVSVSFKPHRFIPINSSKHFVGFCSCFSESETKLRARSLSHDNKENNLREGYGWTELENYFNKPWY